MLNHKNINDGKWVESNKDDIVDKKDIYNLFKSTHILYQEQQAKNLQSAVMVDTDNILELIKSPLHYIPSYYGKGNFQIPMMTSINSYINRGTIGADPFTPEMLLDYNRYNSYAPYKIFANPYTDKKNPLLSIVWDYLKTSFEYAHKPAYTLNLLKKIVQESCLSEEAKNNVRDTVVNIKLREENSLGEYKNIVIDGNKVLFNLLKNETDDTQKQIYNTFPRWLDAVEKGIYKTLEEQLESHIYSKVLDTYNCNIREKLLTDFETYGYAAYYVKKIDNSHKILNMPCGSFMYNKDYKHNISFLCHSYFDEKDLIEYDDNDNSSVDIDKIKSYFKIFIHNEKKECYDVFKITYTGNLDEFVDELKNEIFYNKSSSDKIKIEYKYSVKKIPIIVQVNIVTALYGFANNAQMFKKAIRTKIAELELESLAIEQKNPVMIFDQRALNDSKKEQKHSSVSEMGGVVHQEGAANDNINNNIEGNNSELDGYRSPGTNLVHNPSVSDEPLQNKEELMRPLPVTLPNAQQHYIYQYQSNKQEMRNVGNGKYLEILQMHTQSGMTTTNATKSEQTAMIGMSASFNFFRELLEKSINIIWRDSVFEFIQITTEIYNKAGSQIQNEKLGITESEKMFITMIASVLLDDKKITLSDKNDNDLQIFIKQMYICYVYCFGHYAECPTDLKGLLFLFKDASKQISFVDAISINNKGKYTATRFLEDVTDFMQVIQTAGMSLPEVNMDAIFMDMRKVSQFKGWLNTPKDRLSKLKEQAKDSTWEQKDSKEMMAMAQSKNSEDLTGM